MDLMKFNENNKVPLHWAIFIGLSMIVDGLVMIFTSNWIKSGYSLKSTMYYAQRTHKKQNVRRRKDGSKFIN